MSSVRALANLFCTKCDEVVMHRENRCIECNTVSTSSSNPPVPRPYRMPSTRNATEAINEMAAARRRARRARHQVTQRGRT